LMGFDIGCVGVWGCLFIILANFLAGVPGCRDWFGIIGKWWVVAENGYAGMGGCHIS
jgi:hypothetical protein